MEISPIIVSMKTASVSIVITFFWDWQPHMAWSVSAAESCSWSVTVF